MGAHLTGIEYRGWKIEPALIRAWTTNINISAGWVVVSRDNHFRKANERDSDNKQILCVVSSEKLAREQIDCWHQVQTVTTKHMLGGNHDKGR